ncbi:MAG: GNAT family N-acetyltransferase [Gammaproteobacteria bacterium]
MNNRQFSVRLAHWDEDQPGIRRVREIVFVDEQAVPAELEWDGLDPGCLHAVAESPECDVIGTGRLHPGGKIGRMAVLREWRGAGVGAAVLRCLMDAARDRGLGEVFLHAQTRVLGFYENFGFVAEGDEFEEAGIPHQGMRCSLGGGDMSISGAAAEATPQGTRTVLEGKAEFAEAVAEVSARASRSIAIFTPDLEPGVYDSARFLENVKRLVLSRSHARIRVLISDPTRVIKTVNRFVHFGRRLSTFIEFRQLSEDMPAREDAFLLADDSALVYRARADRWEGIADTYERRMARLYLEQFDQMWHLAEPALELRQLKI